VSAQLDFMNELPCSYLHSSMLDLQIWTAASQSAIGSPIWAHEANVEAMLENNKRGCYDHTSFIHLC
jgi:hypothetical protein